MTRLEQYLWMVQTSWLTEVAANGPSIWKDRAYSSGAMIINDALHEFDRIPADYDLYTAAYKLVGSKFYQETFPARIVYD